MALTMDILGWRHAAGHFAGLQTVDYSGAEDDEARCQILAETMDFVAYAVVAGDGGGVLLKTATGWTLAQAVKRDGAEIVVFTNQRNGRNVAGRFWVNAASVASLGKRLRERTNCRRPMAALASSIGQ